MLMAFSVIHNVTAGKRTSPCYRPKAKAEFVSPFLLDPSKYSCEKNKIKTKLNVPLEETTSEKLHIYF
jgi:hypothetical protein